MDMNTLLRINSPDLPSPTFTREASGRVHVEAQRPHILAVDDQDVVLEWIAHILEPEDVMVRTAHNGYRALDLLVEDAAIRLAILDWKMPVMTGEYLFDQLVSIRPGIRAIVMSGDDPSNVERAFRGRNIAFFVYKPFTADVLLSAVRSVIVA